MMLCISSGILDELQALVRDAGGNEICGLLIGQDEQVAEARHAANVADNPDRHFEIDPAVLIAAEREARGGKMSIIGYFHSHPGGDVKPSKTDAQSAAPDERIWLIINGKDAAAWRSTKNGEIYGRFEPISLDCPLID